MPVDYQKLGARISYFRSRKNFSQEKLCELINVNSNHISHIENGKKRPSLDVLVDIANVLGISVDDLLVDSLMHSTSTADSAIHQLLLDCNELEESVIVKTVESLKSILYSLGI